MGRLPRLRTELLSYTYKPSVIAIRGLRFWHHHPQTACHLTSFCGNFLKKESTAISQKSWKILKDNTEQFVAGTGQQILRNLAGNTVKMANVCLQEGMERFQNLL